MSDETIELTPEEIRAGVAGSAVPLESVRARKNRKLREKRAALKSAPPKKKAAPKKRAAKRKRKKLTKVARNPAIPKSTKKGPKGFTNSGMPRVGNATWGRKVAKARQLMSMTQAQLAEKVGIKQPHMCNVEKGTFNAGPELREKLEGILFRHVGLLARGKKRSAPK